MENYGKTLKKIRESLSFTQTDISAGIMSQSNYSKVENGEIDIPFTKMVDLLDQLGMTIDEFLYIHRDYTKNPGKQLSRLNHLKPGDHMKIIENIDELKTITNPTQREEELLAIFEALHSISNNEYQTADEQVAMIWERLKKHDTWYLYDIRLVNSILYLFPTETAGSIVDLILKRLEEYKNLGNIRKLSGNLQINYLLLLIKNREYQTALDIVENLIHFSMDHYLYSHLAASYVRKEILLENLNMKNPNYYYEKGFEVLEVTNNQKMIQELKKEIKLYTKI